MRVGAVPTPQPVPLGYARRGLIPRLPRSRPTSPYQASRRGPGPPHPTHRGHGCSRSSMEEQEQQPPQRHGCETRMNDDHQQATRS